MEIYQQGDVVIKKIEALPEGEITQDQQTIAKTLAYGEKTGHLHQIVEGEATVMRIFNDLYIKAFTEFKVKHQEHKAFTVPPGIYKVDIVRETDWLTRTTRRVAD